MYIPNKFHATIVRAQRKPFDATNMLKDFGDVCLGQMQVKEVSIKSRAEFETPDGQRMHRDLFKHIKGAEPTFATESAIMLT